MTKLISFGTYTFPSTPLDYRDNFSDIVARTVRMPGQDGGFDTYGSGRAASEIGNVSYSFLLRPTAASGMTTLRDDVMAMARLGRAKLTMETASASQRWTYARVNSIQAAEAHVDRTDLHLRVSVDFQCTSPRWFTAGNENAVLWGSGFNWGNAASVWSGTTAGNAVSGTSTSFTVTPSGTAETYPRIIVTTSGGQSATNIRIQRLVNGVVADEVQYIGTIAASSSLEINTRAYTVTLNGASVYSSFSVTHPSWFRLQPGANTVRVLMANSGDAATVKVLYYDAWY